MSDIKVGDLIGERYHGVYGEIWTAKKVLKINRYGDLRDDSIIVQGGILYFEDTNWQHGIHPSLIPEGFAIVPVEPTSEMQNAARDWAVATLGHAVGGSGSRGCYQAMLDAAPKPTDK